MVIFRELEHDKQYEDIAHNVVGIFFFLTIVLGIYLMLSITMFFKFFCNADIFCEERARTLELGSVGRKISDITHSVFLRIFALIMLGLRIKVHIFYGLQSKQVVPYLFFETAMHPIFALYSDHLMSVCEPDVLLFCEEY
jgi:hypothetical protein